MSQELWLELNLTENDKVCTVPPVRLPNSHAVVCARSSLTEAKASGAQPGRAASTVIRAGVGDGGRGLAVTYNMEKAVKTRVEPSTLVPIVYKQHSEPLLLPAQSLTSCP